MNIHFWTFLFQIFNFVVVAFVLQRLLYRPLHEAIDRRRLATEQAQAEADRAKHDAEALQARLEAERAEAERRREDLVREAHRQADAEGQRLLDEARRRAQEQADDLRRQLAREREEGQAAVRRELVRLAAGLAERFLKQSADRTLHRQLVARLVESLQAVSADERQRLLTGWTADEPAVIETAQELDRQSLDQITAAVSTLLGQGITLETRLKPELVSGVSLRLGGNIWDASLGGPLEEIGREERQEVAHA
ncbi:MAG TPA: F0F1 ATP synthase subunit delta [Pirellulales bacterium]|nr:F0F1 ATP synthase subunit delta [Pirellulales bacterium]